MAPTAGRSSSSPSPTTRRSSPSCASIPQRRFDWDTREWWAPVDDWAGVHVAEVLERFPELTTSAAGRRLAGRHRAPLGRPRDDHAPRRPRLVGPAHPRRDGARGAARGRRRARGRRAAGAADRGRRRGAGRAARRRAHGRRRAPLHRRARARRGSAARAAGACSETVDGTFLRLDVLWDPDVAGAFDALPGAGGAGPHAAHRPVGRRAARRLPGPARRRRRRLGHGDARASCAPSTTRR